MKHYKLKNAHEWLSHRIERMNTEELKSGILVLKEKLSNQQLSSEFYHEMKDSGYHDDRIGDQWANASEWFVSYINELSEDFDLRAVLSSLKSNISNQMIEDEYKLEMIGDGFFDPTAEVNKEDLTVGSIVNTFSQMMFLVIRTVDERNFQVVDLTNIRESKINAPVFDSLSEMYDWFQAPEDDGIESIIPQASLQSFLERMNCKEATE